MVSRHREEKAERQQDEISGWMDAEFKEFNSCEPDNFDFHKLTVSVIDTRRLVHFFFFYT